MKKTKIRKREKETKKTVLPGFPSYIPGDSFEYYADRIHQYLWSIKARNITSGGTWLRRKTRRKFKDGNARKRKRQIPGLFPFNQLLPAGSHAGVLVEYMETRKTFIKRVSLKRKREKWRIKERRELKLERKMKVGHTSYIPSSGRRIIPLINN